VIEIADLRFRYPAGEFALEVPEFRVARGEKVALVGPSGSGKTTLVHLMTGILRPDSGRIALDDRELTGRTDHELRDLRISRVGFVFQEFELLDYLTTLENILLPYLVNRSLTLDAEVRESAKELARALGLGRILARRPGSLSHGERQRVAISRALVTGPGLIVADEPTGHLDRPNAEAIMRLLVEEVERRGATLVMVTHDESLLGSMDRVVDVAAFAGGGAG
jgi:ABC-type lipoprotein export system ATPase subunit